MKFDRSEALRPFNTLGLEAQATACVSVKSNAELAESLSWARERELPVLTLGEGSNIVLAGDVDALVIRQQTPGIEVLASTQDKVSLRVSAGENWHALVCWTLQKGYCGLQNLALIPGRVGAAPIQNIGAYGVELQSVLLSVHGTLIADGRAITLDRSECGFAYRDSIFKHDLQDQLVITAIDIELSQHPAVNTSYPALANYLLENRVVAPTPREVFDAVVHIRSTRLPDPAREANAGSFFKNPLLRAEVAEALVARYPELPSYPQPDGRVKVSAAWMIDQRGWKGFRRNDLGVHPQHALVLVNYGNNNGEQLLSLADEIANSIRETFGVELEIEPRVYGCSR